MSAGIFGLMDAINAFDLERVRVKFETYCAAANPRRDPGRAAVDGLGAAAGDVAGAQAGHGSEVFGERSWEGRPTNNEIAHRLKVSIPEFEKMAKDASAVGVVSLSRKWFETDSNKDVREIDVLEDKRGADPVREIQPQGFEGTDDQGAVAGGAAHHHPLLF